MRLAQKRDRTSRTSMSRSPAPPRSTTPIGNKEDTDTSVGVRLGKRKTMHHETDSRRGSPQSRNYTRANGSDGSDSEHKISYAHSDTSGHTVGPGADSQGKEVVADVTEAHTTKSKDYVDDGPVVSRTADRLGLDHNRYRKSDSPSTRDTHSIASESSSLANVRTSGRRTRPSARMSGHTVPHKDPSEADSLSIHSSLDSTNISILPNSTLDTAKSEPQADLSPESGHSNGPEKHSFRTRHESPDNHEKSRRAPRLTNGARRNRSSPTRSSTPTNDKLHNGSDRAQSVDTATAELQTITSSMARPELNRTTSNSSLSSDLSDLSSISSIESTESRETVSSTGSDTVRVLQECPDDDEGERQRIVARALALTKKWRMAWHTLDKRVKANIKKQERNRAAREQLAAQKTRRR